MVATDVDIPVAVFQKYGLTAKKQGNEFHSPCPACGGRDRMIWYGDDKGNGYCRQCQKTFWLMDLEKLDPLEKLDRMQRAKERETAERAILERRITKFHEQEAYRAGWHDGMNYAARQWWTAQGITEESIDWYGLGACKYPLVNRTTGERVEMNAYTIPIYDPDTWSVVNRQYRLDNPPAGVGKYRQEQGIPARSFYCRQHTGGDVLIVEGAKKAIVVDQLLAHSIQVVGLPGISPSERLIDELACYKRKYFLPDPDVQTAPIKRFQERLQNIKVVRLPVKPDDAITQHGLTRNDLREWLLQTRL
ncbi:MAG: hypothetical protein H0U60_18575 [Blastocatellia bacterium]|nr:hypothetical protein [Blastocatellia bacterium]